MKELIINIHLHEESDLYNPFNENTLNPQLANYIYDECIGHGKDEKIELVITTDFICREIEVTHLIHNYFIQELQEKKIIDKHSNILHILMLLIGIILIMLAYMIELDLFREIFLILGWLSLWEFVYDIIDFFTKDSIRYHRYRQLGNVKIRFN